MASGEEKDQWLADIPETARPFLHKYHGVILLAVVKPSYIDGISRFEMRDSDTFIVTWPKSGTTWMQYLLCQILRGQEVTDSRPLFLTTPFMEFPQLYKLGTGAEPTGQYESAATMPSPRLMKTHLPLSLLPNNLLESGAKIVYVARNPKDAAVSFYHHARLGSRMPRYTDWNEFVDQFCRGLLPFNDWFDHVLTWWNLRHNPNVLFLKYEDMKKDLGATIRTLGDFLGKPLTEKEIEEIRVKSSFENMKASKNVNPDFLDDVKRDRSLSFMRKGEVGDWKNWFTVAQSERFDEIYRSRMEGTGLEIAFV